MPDMPALVSPYSHQQPSPDSQGFADMRLASPQHRPGKYWPLIGQYWPLIGQYRPLIVWYKFPAQTY